MIDPTVPVATPFRANWDAPPRTDFEFKTGIITAADGREQRHPLLRYPRVKVTFSCLGRSAAHAARIRAALPSLMNSAVAIRDFRLNGAGVVSADGMSVVMTEWGASWAATVRVVLEDAAGMAEHAAVIVSADPASRTITLDAPAPELMRGGWCGVGSAVSASLEGEIESDFWHAGAQAFDVTATSFGGLDLIGGAPLADFPLRHGARDAMRITSKRSVSLVDFGIGRRSEAINYASWTSGFRTFRVEALQMDQASKEGLVSFFCGVRGRLRAFYAEGLIPGARFRFGSDVLTVEHLSGSVSRTTVPVAQVVA